MARRMALMIILTTVLALTGCGLDRSRSDGGTPSASPTPRPPVAPAGEEFDACELIDLAAATDAAAVLGFRDVQAGTPLQLTGQRVTMGYGGGMELCWYGPELGGGPLTLNVFPNGFPDDLEVPAGTRQSERPELGPRAAFGVNDGSYYLIVPAADAYLSLGVSRSSLIYDGLDDELVERELAALLLPARDRVPAGARLPGLRAGAACADFEDAVADALGDTPDHSRHHQVGADYSCRFTASTTGADVSILFLDGLGTAARRGLPVDPRARGVAELYDTWLSSEGLLHVVRGADVLQVLLVPDGRVDTQTPLDQRDITQDVALARELAELVFGDR